MSKLKQSHTEINDISIGDLIRHAKSQAPDADEFHMLCSYEAFQQVVCLTAFWKTPGFNEGFIGPNITIWQSDYLGPGMFELHAIGDDWVFAGQVI